MARLSAKTLESYRAKTFRYRPGRRVTSLEQAVEFVNERGFIYFWPINGVLLPSLWVAVAGDRPVAEAHDDPGHVSWSWKDALLGTRRWYYAKVLRKRSTILSLAVAPYFYALSENYGSPEDDYLSLYEQGRMTQEAKSVYEALLLKGPLDTIALRQATRMTSRESDARFNRALAELQADFKVLPVAVTQAGGWRYAYAYDLVHRHFPQLPEQARFIGEGQARQELARLYLRSVGACQVGDLVRLFGWAPSQASRALQALVEAGSAAGPLEIENQAGEWFAWAELLAAG